MNHSSAQVVDLQALKLSKVDACPVALKIEPLKTDFLYGQCGQYGQHGQAAKVVEHLLGVICSSTLPTWPTKLARSACPSNNATQQRLRIDFM
jgi:hypothetical protein